MALEWTDVNLAKRQLTVARSEWKGHVTATKGAGKVVEAAGVEPASESTSS